MDGDHKYIESAVQLWSLGIWNGLGSVKDLIFKVKYVHYIAIQSSYAMFCCMWYIIILSLQVLKACGLLVDVGKSYVAQQRWDDHCEN